jgi:hypothetical protein
VGSTINRSNFATSSTSEWDYYLVDANVHGDSLFLFVGNAAGQVLITKLGLDGDRTMCVPVGELRGGHNECIIRSVWSDSASFDRIISAGEDGRVCTWHGGEPRKYNAKPRKSKTKTIYKPY